MKNIHPIRKNNHRTKWCQVQQNDATIDSQRTFRIDLFWTLWFLSAPEPLDSS